jgi:DNA-binding FrmR family transcriptional regulator
MVMRRWWRQLGLGGMAAKRGGTGQQQENRVHGLPMQNPARLVKHTPHGYLKDMRNCHPATGHADHRAQLPRLRRVEGQVRGIARMVEEGRYCVDVLAQLAAARAALARIERDVLDAHAGACVAAAMASRDADEQAARLAELAELLKRALR